MRLGGSRNAVPPCVLLWSGRRCAPPPSQLTFVERSALPYGNTIIDALPDASIRTIFRSAKVVTLDPSQITTFYGKRMATVDFPVNALLSVLGNFEDGETAEITTVGREGFVEIDAALHHDYALRTSRCLFSGTAIRIPLTDFQLGLGSDTYFADGIYHAVRARAFITEQLTICSIRHSAEQRFARWLALASWKLGANEIALTQEVLASLLGIRRATVTIAAQQLQASGAIRYARGVVTIADVKILHSRACMCFDEIRDVLIAAGLPGLDAVLAPEKAAVLDGAGARDFKLT
jgi:CRP-like cAMP-binding protein